MSRRHTCGECSRCGRSRRRWSAKIGDRQVYFNGRACKSSIEPAQRLAAHGFFAFSACFFSLLAWVNDIKREKKNKLIFRGRDAVDAVSESRRSKRSAQGEHRLPGSNVQMPRNSLARYFRARQERPGCQAHENHADTEAHVGQDVIAFYRVDSIR